MSSNISAPNAPGPGLVPNTVNINTAATMEPINPSIPMSGTKGSSRSTSGMAASEHLRRIQAMNAARSQNVVPSNNVPSITPVVSIVQNPVPQSNVVSQPTPSQTPSNQPIFYQNAPQISLVPSQAEIRGRVRRINMRSPRNSKIFWVWTEKLNREFKCRANFFCPVREGDAVSGIVEFNDLNNPQEELVFIQPPFVEIGMDKDSVSRTFLKFLRGTGFGNTKALDLYDRFYALALVSEQMAKDREGPVNISVESDEKHPCPYF